MIALSTSPIRFVPEMFEATDPTVPAFFLRPGSVIERDMLEAELAGDYLAARVFGSEFARAFAEGISVLMADDPGRDTLLALAAAEQNLEDGAQLAPDERQLLAGAREVLSEHWPEYRALVKQANRRHQLLPLVAFRRFCTGWENIEEARLWAAGPDKLVTLEAARSIPVLLMKLAGLQAYGMLYAGGEAKNSEAPSKSGADQTTSTSA